ncbi:MAG: hypothetical protein M1537_01595 [Nitrospirae bacterium]|nr:hypothetical protein [Nitrospirota bacterium]MCL5284163.1 hypothetical protein [Nitrospirota bacterium]
MASRFLTEPFERFRRSFSPAQILTGRISNGQLLLSSASPARKVLLWPEQPLSLDGEGEGPASLPLSLEERKDLPLVLFWPAEQTVSASLRLPPSVTTLEKEAAIGALIELRLPWPIEESLLAWETDPADSSEVHAWAISRTALEGWLGKLRAIGLAPRWVLPESLLVLERFFPHSPDRGQGATDHKPSGMIAADGGRILCLLSRGGHIAAEAAFSEPDVPKEARDRRILDLLFSFLAEGHRLPERFLRDPAVAPSPGLAAITGPLPDLPKETALAGWRLVSGRSREDSAAFSFLKGPLAWQGDKAERRAGLRVLGLLSLLLIATLVADASVHLSRIDHRLEAARRALDQAASRALPGRRIVEPVGQLTQELAALDRQKELLSRGPDVIRIMRDLTTAPPSGVTYEMVSLNVTRRFFTVSGKTDSFKSVDKLKKAFEATGHMRDLTIQSAGLDIDRKTVTFRMRGRHD